MKHEYFALSSLVLLICTVGCNQNSFTTADSANAQSTDTSTTYSDKDPSSSGSSDESTIGRDSANIEEVKYSTLTEWFSENESKFVSKVQNKTLRFRAVIVKIVVEDSNILVVAQGDEDMFGLDRFVILFDKEFVDDLAKIEIGQTVTLTCTYKHIESVKVDAEQSQKRIPVYVGEKITGVKSE